MFRNPQFKAYLALAAVCFFWGTTYLGIRIALESLSPAMLLAIRYSISGAVMLAAALLLRARLPAGRELALTALFGALVLGVGNGCLAVAEQWIPSGLAAIFITTSPFWMVGMEALFPGGEGLHGPTIAGMLVGLAGTLLLVAPGALANGLHGPVLRGFLVLQLGQFGWSLGSILHKRHSTKAHPVTNGAVQQLATGLVYVLPAFWFRTQPMRPSGRSLSAVAYLIVFGSIVGYSAYLYALEKLPVTVVSLYNYVNPVVAVFLGWLFYHERFGVTEIAAMLIIFTGVYLVKRFGHRPLPAAISAPALVAHNEAGRPTAL